MDAFALLCNLHGNGPLTLRRLRRAGIHTLEQVAGLPPEQLSTVLAGPVNLAVRFATEARELARRVAAEPLEPEDPRDVATRTRQAPLPLTPRSSPPEPPQALWPERPEPQQLPEPGLRSAQDTEAPDLKLAQGDAILAPGLLKGLDRALCERLVAEGVRTLETLSAMTELSFARRVGISYPKLLELQYQARCNSRDVIVPVPPPPARHLTFPRVPALPPSPARDSEHPITKEVSGPFA
jgi:hypothetical protein